MLPTRLKVLWLRLPQPAFTNGHVAFMNGHVELLKAKFDERSKRGRLALLASYRDSWPRLYELVLQDYGRIVLANYHLHPVFIAQDKPLENDKPAALSVKRRHECILQTCVKRRLGMVCDSHWL